MTFKTPQENFWQGQFGNEYSERCSGPDMIAENLRLFVNGLRTINHPITNCIEFGANIGNNLIALKLLYPNIKMHAVEINKNAVDKLASIIKVENIHNQSILEYKPKEEFEISLVKLVLIHINPDYLKKVYQNLYHSSSKYIFICEYFNTQPISVEYRGHHEKLFKRDFAGEILDLFPDLKIKDYGCVWRRDPNSIKDDANWFLLEKNNQK